MTYDEKGSLIGLGSPIVYLLPFAADPFSIGDKQQFAWLYHGIEVAEEVFQTLTLLVNLPVRVTAALSLATRAIQGVDLPTRVTAGVDIEL